MIQLPVLKRFKQKWSNAMRLGDSDGLGTQKERC